jgi:S-DNA-T family DNA segregation ATPase FtsK/SpoIIIE
MPRLVIVIDELTSLARELPDFTTRLANIAQRGRSLGIHVIMSTRRPSASASSAIGGASSVRIALRLTEPGDSAAVIEQPDAARIDKDAPGRGYVRLGGASLVPFQAGRIGGHRHGPGPADGGRGDAAARRAVWLAPADWSEAGRRAPVPPATLRALHATSDLAVLVAEIRRAAWELSIPQRPPWVPPQP